MNRRPAHPLAAPIRQAREVTRIALVGLTLAGSVSPGCIEINGGAAELSWALRSVDGASVETCGEVRIADVRLCWQAVEEGSASAVGGECASGQRRDFPCGESSGITGFDLPSGETAFWIEPVCQDGGPAGAGTYQVPPPIVRNVEEGEIVSLSSLLLVVNPPGDGCPAAGCTCVRP